MRKDRGAEIGALLETLDMGKPILNARNADMRAVAECVRWYGEAIDKWNLRYNGSNVAVMCCRFDGMTAGK